MIVKRNDLCPCGSGLKFKKCHLGKIVPHISKNFVISVRKDKEVFKIFQINFHQNIKGQASIIVSLPYFKKTLGLLSRMTYPANTRKVDKISMKIGGRTTSHAVKFSHWLDGNTHFSQDGKVFTTIRNSSNTLNSSIGHLFTLQIQGLDGFNLKDDDKRKTLDKTDLDVTLEDEIKSIKFTAWWYDSSVVHDSGNHYGNPYFFKRDNGVVDKAFALRAPQGSPLSDKILFLSFSAMPFLTKERGSHLLFLGGFDPKEIFNDISNDFHFLSALYPARNYKKLVQEVGSIDIIQNLK